MRRSRLPRQGHRLHCIRSTDPDVVARTVRDKISPDSSCNVQRFYKQKHFCLFKVITIQIGAIVNVLCYDLDSVENPFSKGQK